MSSPRFSRLASVSLAAIGRRWSVFACLLTTLLATSGCMHRRMTINSNPPGAIVFLEGNQIGRTPVSIDFTYYGTREIKLIKDGYEPLTVMQKVPTPWYQVIPFEFVTDNLALQHVHDRREFTYNLRPQPIVPTQETIDRANRLRSEAQIP